LQHLRPKMPEWVTPEAFGRFTTSERPRQRLRSGASGAPGGMIASPDAVAAGCVRRRKGPVRCGTVLRAKPYATGCGGFAQSCEALADAQAAICGCCAARVLPGHGDEIRGPPSIAQAIADKVEGATVKVLERAERNTTAVEPAARLSAPAQRTREGTAAL